MILLIVLLSFTCLQVQQKRWKVETNSRLDSVLLLSAVNLPGGELVRCLFCHPAGGGNMSKATFYLRCEMFIFSLLEEKIGRR